MRSTLLLIAILTLALAACGGEPSSDLTPPSAELPADAAIASPSDESEASPTSGANAAPAECAAVLTPSNPEGPFYSPGAPERSSLVELDSGGTPVMLMGRVMTLDCEPIPGALLDFWQTDDSGEYDNVGFRYRGKLFADDEGHYQLQTTLPGLYPGRPAHIHVKVTPPDGTEHTTQIYFPGRQFGDADQFVDEALIASLEETSDGLTVAIFDFVLRP